MKEKTERNKSIRWWHKKGYSYRNIGFIFGISKQRCHQIDHQKQDGFWGRLFDTIWLFLFSKD